MRCQSTSGVSPYYCITTIYFQLKSFRTAAEFGRRVAVRLRQRTRNQLVVMYPYKQLDPRVPFIRSTADWNSSLAHISVADPREPPEIRIYPATPSNCSQATLAIDSAKSDSIDPESQQQVSSTDAANINNRQNPAAAISPELPTPVPADPPDLSQSEPSPPSDQTTASAVTNYPQTHPKTVSSNKSNLNLLRLDPSQ